MYTIGFISLIDASGLFGNRIYAEAVGRGMARAQQVIVLGDGAKWIWGIADEHFPGATQIVDLYHAREQLAKVAKLVHGSTRKSVRNGFQLVGRNLTRNTLVPRSLSPRLDLRARLIQTIRCRMATASRCHKGMRFRA